MNIDRDFKVKINEEEIIKLLGYKGNKPDEEILMCIREEMKNCSSYIDAEVYWEKVKINKVNDLKIILENNVEFEGEYISKKLFKCSYIVAFAATIGKKAEDMVKEAFDRGDYLKAMVIDNIGISALEQINKIFWRRRVDEIKETNTGITSRLSPGSGQWDIKEQQKIFKCLTGNKLKITLTESNMMIPVKSASAVYGFGEGIGITRVDHHCSECNMKNCSYRMTEKVQIIINYKGKKNIIEVEKGSNLLDVIRKENFFVQSPCGGSGTCGKCRVKFIKGLEEPSVTDKRHLSEQELINGYRLACKVYVQKTIEIIVENEVENIKGLTENYEPDIKVNSLVSKKHLVLNEPDINDQRDDLKKIKEALGIENLEIDIDLLREIPSELREAKFNISASLYKNVLLGIESGNTVGEKYGIAIDIGTTTIAYYLINLNDGKTIDTESEINKQSIYGADVISRINFSMENESGIEILKEVLIDQINNIIEVLCYRNGISDKNIYDISVAGNTTMLHLLLGLSVKNIAIAPFIPVFTNPMDFKAKELGIKINGFITILPGISSYLGSDITAGILACGMAESEKYSLLIDLGTNGEIALGNCDRIVTCSTAAGPAFEGANIKWGIGGVNGAISKVDFNKEQIYETINHCEPIGICGSGVLDTVSEFIKHGIIDETGRMAEEDEITNIVLKNRITEKDGRREFILAEASEDKVPIVFTQKDVREVQLAKAAVTAGIKLIIEEMKLKYHDIENVYIGGGFGTFMNVESSISVGLIPKELKEKIHSIGNCSGMGAKMYLISEVNREKAVKLAQKAEYIELSGRKEFQDYFVDSMLFINR